MILREATHQVTFWATLSPIPRYNFRVACGHGVKNTPAPPYTLEKLLKYLEILREDYPTKEPADD